MMVVVMGFISTLADKSVVLLLEKRNLAFVNSHNKNLRLDGSIVVSMAWPLKMIQKLHATYNGKHKW